MTRYLFKVLIFIIAIKAYSQSNDTIYIYETVEVYDTIFVYDTVYRNVEIDKIQPKNISYSFIQVDTLNKKANLILISPDQTATLPIHSISISENIKIDDDMKKIKFLGLMIIAANSMLFAQSDYGITVGGGAWWAQCNQPESSKEYSNIMNIGMFFKQNFKNSFFC